MFWQVSSRVQDLSWSFPGSYQVFVPKFLPNWNPEKHHLQNKNSKSLAETRLWKKLCHNFKFLHNSIMYTQETPPEMPQNEQMEQVLTTVGTQTCLTKIVLNWSIILRSTNDQQLDFGIWILQRYKSSYKIMKSGWIWHPVLIIILRTGRRTRSCHF